jgi:hypothetical protein
MRPCAIRGKTMRNATAGRKVNAGMIANGTPILNCRALSSKVMVSADLIRGCSPTIPTDDCYAGEDWFLSHLVNSFAAYNRTKNLRIQYFWRRRCRDVLIENNKVG